MGSSHHHEGLQGAWNSILQRAGLHKTETLRPQLLMPPWRIQGTYRAVVAELMVGRNSPLTFLVPELPVGNPEMRTGNKREGRRWGRGVTGSMKHRCQCTKILIDFCTRLAMKIKKEKSPDFVRWAHGKLW